MQLINGDCLEVMASLPEQSIDMVLCDPPYGVTACKWDSVIDLEEIWEQLKRVARPDAPFVFTASQPFTTSLIMSNKDDFRYSMVWQKNSVSGFFNAKKRPLRNHEDILVFYKLQPTYNPGKLKVNPIKSYCSSELNNVYRQRKVVKRNKFIGYPKSIVDIKCVYNKNLPNDPLSEQRIHPTQKPVALMSYLMGMYTNPGDTVLDFAMGSGSTGVACVQSDRDFIGIELDEGYYSKAVDWIGRQDQLSEEPRDTTQISMF